MLQIHKHINRFMGTFKDPRNTAIPSGKLCKLMPRKRTKKKKKNRTQRNKEK